MVTDVTAQISCAAVQLGVLHVWTVNSVGQWSW